MINNHNKIVLKEKKRIEMGKMSEWKEGKLSGTLGII